LLASSRVKKRNEDYEKVPLLHPGRMKTGAAFNQQNDYRPFVSKVKGILAQTSGFSYKLFRSKSL